ncbi:methyltransferase domain-containing protein [Candidatus Parcubacteria bacterium]|jgi:tRNA G10  N-methylase Trm11|nr:MAG: methyltransferase domain-containing protein [Candidatus Parcubacteria bacterium]
MEVGQLIAIFGREPSLSLWELSRNLGCADFEVATRDLAVFDSPQNLEVAELQSRSGGLVKVGRIMGVVDALSGLAAILEKNWPDLIPAGSTARVNFGVSAYDAGQTPDRHFRTALKRQAQRFKKYLTANHRSARLVESKESTLPASALVQGKILQQGFEILVLVSPQKLYWGVTLTVQDISRYGRRDFGRPARDSHSGMLPPKVAQILINLTQPKSEEVFLDPFCGSGTILQEAALMGLKKILGSDLSQKAVSDSLRNLDWLKQKYEPVDLADLQIFESDIKELPAKLKSESIDLIATEPYLGPPQKGRAIVGNILPLVSALSRQYIPWLEILGKLLKPAGRMAMVWPFFKVENHGYFLQLQQALPQTKLKIIPPSKHFLTLPWFRSTPRGTVLYSRPDQVVGREIVLLGKNV